MEILINIDVPDLDRAITFYTQAFALRVKRKIFGGTVAELEGGTNRILLLVKPEGSLPSVHGDQTRAYRRHWTPVHLDFVVADVHLALAQAVRAGGNLEGAVQTFEWGRLAVMSDPFGNGVCLIEWIGGGYDAVET